jgi:fatty acid-binding protein DegV
MIGICTDSNSQLPHELAERFGVEVVPLTVVVDGREYLEGVDLDPDDFYEAYTEGHRPRFEFTQPSSGQFAAAYDDLIARGCTQIVSIHTSAASSGTLKAARLAAHMAPVPVRLVDSGTARFGLSCCVWAAGEAIAAGANLDEAAVVAESLAPSIRNVFIRGGHLAGCRPGPRNVLSLVDGDLEVLGQVETVADAINAMSAFTVAQGRGLHVAVGSADRSTFPVAEALAHAIGEAGEVIEVIQFRIGPSVGFETGPGGVGCVVYPTIRP